MLDEFLFILSNNFLYFNIYFCIFFGPFLGVISERERILIKTWGLNG